jgi:gamma-glutamylcyclotransferase (GGCT)/AIG2-like uncharacterized protein YtfP
MSLSSRQKERKASIHKSAQKARTVAQRKGVRGNALYFAYGSNLHVDQMNTRCPTAVPVAAATLSGWKLTFRGVADIVEGNVDDMVYGALFEIQAKDEHALDVYEGFPHLYDKQSVIVKTVDGYVNAMVYTMVNQRHVSRPSDYYFNVLREGFRNWSLPQVMLHDAKRVAVGVSKFMNSVERHAALFAAEARYAEYNATVTPEEQVDDFVRYVVDAEDEALMSWAKSLNN